MKKDIDLKFVIDKADELFPLNSTGEALREELIVLFADRPQLKEFLFIVTQLAISQHGAYLGALMAESIVRTVVLVIVGLEDEQEPPEEDIWSKLLDEVLRKDLDDDKSE